MKPTLNNARRIIRGWIAKASASRNKYNVALTRAVEDWTEEVAADYRDGSDTGSEMQYAGVDRD